LQPTFVNAPPAAAGAGRHRDDIQGIRALAVLMVVAYHAGLPVPGGFTGPDVFFVVSGFVVTGMLLRERIATGRIAIVRFYLKRARRLAPALAIVALATLAMAVFVFSPIGPDQEVTGRAVGAAATIRANIYFLRQTGGYFQPAAQKNPFLHTWTLSIEEQFYLAFPIVLLALWWVSERWRTGGRWAMALLALGCLGSLGASVALSYGHVPYGWAHLANAIGSIDPMHVAFFLPVTRAWEFLAGVLLAFAAVQWTPGRLVRGGAAAAGLALLVVTTAAVRSTDVFPGVVAMLPVIAALGLLVAGLGAPSDVPAPVVTRLLSTKPFVWIGDRSYSWYLWHWPLIVYARALYVGTASAPIVAAAVSLVLAALSFRLVEDPIRRRRVWPSPKATVFIAAVSVAVPLACAIAFISVVERGWGDREIADIRATAAPNHIDITTACASMAPLGDPARPPCTWMADGSRGTLLLIGDSHAGHFSEAFLAAVHALQYDAELATAGGCPFLQRPAYQSEPCREFVEGSVAAIAHRARPYDAIVVSNATLGYLDGPLAPPFAADASPGAPVTRPAEIAGWVASLRRTIQAIGRRSPVVVVGDVPQFYQMPQCLRPTLFTGPSRGCGVQTPAWAAAWRTDVVTEERAAVLSLGATYLDAGAKLCPPGQGCSAFLDGRAAYRDGGHLNVSATMTFAPDFQAALAAAIARGVMP
jgi:peptidoglycan/LPS O-acetylase OafA/YrhL